jgi:hypothetical protein
MLLNCALDGLYHLRVTFDKDDTCHLTRAVLTPFQAYIVQCRQIT